MSDDEDQQGSDVQGEQDDSEASGDDESETSTSSGDSALDRPNDIVEDIRGGEQRDPERR